MPSKSRANAVKRLSHRGASYDHLSEKAEEFIEKSANILQIFREKNLERHKCAEVTPFNRPLNIFKREAYHHIRETVHSQGGHKIIKNIHFHSDITHKGPSYAKNPFYWGLLAMDHEREHATLTPQEVGLLARQMQYADRHNVPPCLLVGFLHQAGITAGISQEKSRVGFEPWDNEQMFVEYEEIL